MMDLSYQTMKTANEAREAEEARTQSRRKSLLILIYHHLMEQGFLEAAGALDLESNSVVSQFDVCDNVDLETVLTEYESYYYVKFHRKPRLTRRRAEPVETRPRSNRKYRTPRSAAKPLPKIGHAHSQHSRGGTKTTDSKMAAREASKTAGEAPPTLSELGLNVSSITKNNASGDGGCDKKDLSEYTMQDEECTDRPLKPLSLFNGINNEMKELYTLISRDIHVHSPHVRFDDIIGLDDAKRLVKEAVVYPARYPQLFTGLLSPWKALLLYGPPGTGKTLLAKAVATECNTTFFNISASSIISKWRGDSERLVRVLFELARHHAPSTIFLDELEAVMGRRGTSLGEHESSGRMKTELLIQMDGLSRSDRPVFVLAASNLPWELDPAMLRRLEKRVLVPLPSRAARRAMLSHWLPPVVRTAGAELRTELDYEALAQETGGYSGSDLRVVCKEAAMRPTRKVLQVLDTHTGSSDPPPAIRLETVVTADMLEVLTCTKPSARNLMERYTAWESEYQSV